MANYASVADGIKSSKLGDCGRKIQRTIPDLMTACDLLECGAAKPDCELVLWMSRRTPCRCCDSWWLFCDGCLAQDWANQTLETKMAMMLTEDLLAELQKKCNP